MSKETTKKSIFDKPILSTKVKSANVKLFPEAGLGYFIGPTLALFCNSVLNSYLTRYFTDVLGLTRWAKEFATLLPILSVIAIVIGNILVGKMMDRGKSKAGKARPLLLIALPLIAIAVLFLFLNPFAVSNGQINESLGVLIWVAIGYNLYYAIAYPFYYTSHSSLVNLSSRNSSHRGLLGTVSMATQLAAIGMTSMILPFFLDKLFVSEGGAVDPIKSMNAWRIFAIAIAVVAAFGIICEYYFTRERVTEEQFALRKAEDAETKKQVISTKKQAKACLADKYWWLIILLFFFYQLGGMLKNNSQNFFFIAWSEDLIKGNQLHGTLSIIGSIPTAVGMLLVWPLAHKFGKAKTILFGSILAAIGGAIGFIDSSNFGVVATSFIIKSLGSTPAMYLSISLLSDVLDHNEALHKFRSDGLTMTIYGAIMIGMPGLANGIITGLLSATGYNATEGIISTPAIKTALQWTFLGGETICYLAIAALMIFMGVEKFSKYDHEAIVENQRAEAEAAGIEYVEPSVRLAEEQKKAEEDSEKAAIEELRVRCEKKHLNFEEELQKHNEKKEENAKKAAEKKAAADAKKAKKEEAKKAAADAKEAKRIADLKAKCEAENLNFEEEEQKYQDDLAARAKERDEKKAARDAAIRAEFDAMREKASA